MDTEDRKGDYERRRGGGAVSGYDKAIEHIVNVMSDSCPVPICHSPATSAGEKLIYRCSPAKYDGMWEEFTVTVRFISSGIKTAFARSEEISRALCTHGDAGAELEDGSSIYVTRDGTGGSGYIGRTGYFFVMARFRVKRRLSAASTGTVCEE